MVKSQYQDPVRGYSSLQEGQLRMVRFADDSGHRDMDFGVEEGMVEEVYADDRNDEVDGHYIAEFAALPIVV